MENSFKILYFCSKQNMARDKYHDLVKNALVNEGWEITHDPFRFPRPSRPIEIDLGAERIIEKR